MKHSGEDGDDADNLYTGDWVLFDDLKFLRDTMTGRQMSGTISSSEQEEQSIVTEDHPDERSQSPREREVEVVGDLADIDFMDNIIVEEEQAFVELPKAPGMFCEVCVGNYNS